MPRPLQGIKVLEIANFIAGPYCGAMLADMGADVIKIESPNGDMTRPMPPQINGESVSFVVVNRNKRSIVLDLKTAEAREIVLRMAAASDVLIENNRPGSMEKLGLGPEDLKKVNPKLVYISVSGFGQSGPYRRRAGVNLIAEAASGTLSVQGDPDDLPMRPGIETADMFGALFAAYGAVCGLLGAHRFGEGNTADIALVEASIAAAPWQTSGFLATGEVPRRLGHRHRQNAPYQVFRTGDGRHVALGTPNHELFIRLMKALGLDHYLDDPRFASYVKRKENEEAIVAIVSEALQGWTADAIEARLMEEGVPCSKVNNFDEVFRDPHIVERGVVVEIEHPKLGTVKAVRNPVNLAHNGPTIDRPAPLLGQHSREVLREFGYSDEEIAAFARSGVTMIGEEPAAEAAE